ncbi:hypothetical protein H0E87_031633 [Populus deltoides]|uniref:Methyltransferase type 11 domain-containing protein n=1 Tax=Populus deltoides TaxID=3696 RepID=A0A8T2WI98_POPDE|nr:hypothetical protein H0E87_031633 [Populus deltoides]
MLAIHPKPKPRLRSWHPPIVANLQTISSLPFKTRVFPATKTTNTLNESNETERSSAGKIKRLVLSKEGRTKLNSYPDTEFYSYPRFVTHVDDGFISTLTNLYQEMLRPDSEILDLMSSWDLNQDQKLELESSSFDAVLCTVFAEVFRVLRPGGVFIVSFSNRLFYEKAISAWRDGTGYSRQQLGPQQEKSPFSWITRLLGLVSGSDPFYAVVAYKNFKPVYE